MNRSHRVITEFNSWSDADEYTEVAPDGFFDGTIKNEAGGWSLDLDLSATTPERFKELLAGALAHINDIVR